MQKSLHAEKAASHERLPPLTKLLQVLAMGIVVVFFVGLVKLWTTNRYMRRLEALDAEKQTRTAQIRKSGLLPHGGSSRFRPGAGKVAIPFGVKALEAGVEVEGVWVARMASMASRPPERKWNSRRKVRPGMGVGVGSHSPAPSVEMNDLGGGGAPSKRAWRGSKTAGVISRREIMEPSGQTRDKLENLSLLEEEEEEEERQSKDLVGKNGDTRLLAGPIDDEQLRTSYHGHKGALGKLQRGLKKMTSSETWHDQKKHHVGGDGRLDAKEFHEGAQAKKPQRFYPTSPPPKKSAATTAPLVTPEARSQANRQRTINLSGTRILKPLDEAPVEIQNIGRPPADIRGQSFAVRKTNARQERVSNRSSSSVDSFVTTIEEPRDTSRRPRGQPPHHDAKAPSDGESRIRSRPEISPRRSSLRHSQSRSERRSSEERRSSLDGAGNAAHAASAAAVAAEAPTSRYPPNSSRSAPATRRRSNSSTQQQQDQQAGSTPPSPTVSSCPV